MRNFIQCAILGLTVGLGSSFAASTVPAAPTATYATVYKCQKRYHGCWQTVRYCYSRRAALRWYHQQDRNARIIAQK